MTCPRCEVADAERASLYTFRTPDGPVTLAACHCGYKVRSLERRAAKRGLTRHNCERWATITQARHAAAGTVLADEFQRAIDRANAGGYALSYTRAHGWRIDFPTLDPFLDAPMADDDPPLPSPRATVHRKAHSDILCTPAGAPILVTVTGRQNGIDDAASKTQNDVAPDAEAVSA